MKIYLLYCTKCALQNTDDSIWDNKILLLFLSALVGILASITTTIITERLKRRQIIHTGINALIECLENKKQNHRKRILIPSLDFYTEKKIAKKKLKNSLDHIMFKQYDDSSEAEKDIEELVESLKRIKNIQFKLKKA